MQPQRQIPLLFLSDSPELSSGLAHIGRDLATLLATSSPKFRVGYLGLGGTGHASLPFQQYVIQWNMGTGEGQWGEWTLPQVWREFSRGESGIIFTIWDASRLLWLAQPEYAGSETLAAEVRQMRETCQLWGYFPFDATGPDNKLSRLPIETLMGYDRVLAYTRWGRDLIRRSLGEQESARRGLDWLPHGLKLSTFYPREMERSDKVRVGVVSTNQARKDWGLVFEAFARLREQLDAELWAHTDLPIRTWSLPALAHDFGVEEHVTLTTDDVSPNVLASRYSSCDVTWAPGLGEGFGYPICFPAGTYIETVGGARCIEDIRVGTLVVSANGTYRPVDGVKSRAYTGLLTVITPQYGGPLRLTPEHEVYTRNGWKAASTLTTRDMLFVPRQQLLEGIEGTLNVDLAKEVPEAIADAASVWFYMGYSGKTGEIVKVPRWHDLNEELGRLLGLYVAEGYSGEAACSWSFHAKEVDYIQFVCDWLKNRLGIQAKVRHKGWYPGVEVVASGTVLARWLRRWCGKGARNKHIPISIFVSPPHVQWSFLRGLFEGDGCVTQSSVSLTSSSRQLVEDTRALLRLLGYVASVFHRERIWKGEMRNESTLTISGDDGRTIASILKLPLIDRRRSRRPTPRKLEEAENGWWIPIRKVGSTNFRGTVYNLSVEDDPTYLAAGVAVHNCESLACGVPVVHGAYGGAREMLDESLGRVGALVSPLAWRYETPFNCLRPVFDAQEWADATVALLEDKPAPATCRARVEHLDWKRLFPLFKRWFERGVA